MFKMPNIEVLPGGRKVRALPSSPEPEPEVKPKRKQADKPETDEAEPTDEE